MFRIEVIPRSWIIVHLHPRQLQVPMQTLISYPTAECIVIYNYPPAMADFNTTSFLSIFAQEGVRE